MPHKDVSINGQIEPKDFEIWDFYKYISFGSAVKKLLKHITLKCKNLSLQESFSADLITRDPQNDRRILIENQLEQTDHTHLGQILNYLAWLEAVMTILVVYSCSKLDVCAPSFFFFR